MSGACSANRGEEERVEVIDRKARGKGTIRKAKTYLSDMG
jgi:hypothetical protein